MKEKGLLEISCVSKHPIISYFFPTKNNIFLADGGFAPLVPLVDMSAKNVSFLFVRLPLTQSLNLTVLYPSEIQSRRYLLARNFSQIFTDNVSLIYPLN